MSHNGFLWLVAIVGAVLYEAGQWIILRSVAEYIMSRLASGNVQG